MSKDKEPRYVPDDEAANNGFFPDEPGSDLSETHGNIPMVYLGQLFEAPSGTIKVKDETLELPPQVRQTAQVIDVGLDGELHARRASASQRGGGLKVVKKKPGDPRTHHKASFPVKFHFPKDD